jgi:hypothetical protein
VVASEPADLPLDAALLVRTLDSGLAIEGFDEWERTAVHLSASTRWRENPITLATAALRLS